MKISILGSNGMLGYGVKKYFNNDKYDYLIDEIPRNKFDVLINTLSDLEILLKDSDVVINCIGVIKPMIDKYSNEEVIKINSIFPRNLAKLCIKYNIKCFHITTDCAYSGKDGNYNELSILDANDFYGISKIAGENADCMTIRTSIIGEELNNGRSLIEWILNQKNKTANGFINHKWNGVTTTHLAHLIDYIIKNDLYSNGIYHVFSNIVNKYELLNYVNDIYNLNITINEVEDKKSCDRTLSTIKLLNYKLPKVSLYEQIIEMKNIFNSSL